MTGSGRASADGRTSSTVATRRETASPRASDTVATRYTTAANADSTYATGASWNLVAIWTPERPVAARANRAVDGDQHPAEPAVGRPSRYSVAGLSQRDQPRPAGPGSP